MLVTVPPSGVIVVGIVDDMRSCAFVEAAGRSASTLAFVAGVRGWRVGG